MTDYERGVNQASAIYQEVINDYVAENEKLRDELRKMDQWHSAELTAALDENAKLRNLVVKAHTCERCCADCYQDDGCCPIEREMQELGVVVDS